MAALFLKIDSKRRSVAGEERRVASDFAGHEFGRVGGFDRAVGRHGPGYSSRRGVPCRDASAGH